MPITSTSTHEAAGLDVGACRALLRGGSKSFHAASLLLPSSLRDSATGLYAFCRVADDAVDGGGDPLQALDSLRHRLELICRGEPLPIAADRAFAVVVQRHGIPRALPEALLEGFAWDAQGRRYPTFSALLDYAARVAGSVGVMMALMMGQRDAAVLARASDLGVAMQLTNIARDVGEDARNGRLYLPESWLREAGIDPQAWLGEPRFVPGLAQVLQRLLGEADALYARAAQGIAWLPWHCRPSMHAARVLYAQIGQVLRERHFDSVSARASVSLSRKLALLPRVLGASLHSRASLSGQLAETRFLVEAVPALRVATPVMQPSSRAEWLLELFERLEREQLASRESA